MRRPYGLRPRLFAALVLTAAVTLLAAALTLLGPLQERLRDDSARSLQAAVATARPAIARGLQRPDYPEAQRLAGRTNSRVVLYGTAPNDTDREPRYDSETGEAPPPPGVFRALVD